MCRLVCRRLLFAGVLVILASSASMLLTRVAPGDLSLQLGPFASPAEVASLRARYGLDRTLVEHWWFWAGRAVRLDFGESFLYGRPVAPLVGRAALNTFILGASALVLATLGGIALGVFTGSRAGTFLTGVVRACSLACLSLPSLVTSLLLVFVAAQTGWFPPGGMSSAGAVDGTWWSRLLDVARHLPVPAVALALPLLATLERLQSQAMSDAIRQPFLVAAAARGVSARGLIWRHAWPVSLQPMCGVYGLAVGALLSGSFIVEYVTAWPGMGRLMYEALRARDIYLVAGCAAMGSLVLATGTLVGDLLLAIADPRVRDEGGA